MGLLGSTALPRELASFRGERRWDWGTALAVAGNGNRPLEDVTLAISRLPVSGQLEGQVFGCRRIDGTGGGVSYRDEIYLVGTKLPGAYPTQGRQFGCLEH